MSLTACSSSEVVAGGIDLGAGRMPAMGFGGWNFGNSGAARSRDVAAKLTRELRNYRSDLRALGQERDQALPPAFAAASHHRPDGGIPAFLLLSVQVEREDRRGRSCCTTLPDRLAGPMSGTSVSCNGGDQFDCALDKALEPRPSERRLS